MVPHHEKPFSYYKTLKIQKIKNLVKSRNGHAEKPFANLYPHYGPLIMSQKESTHVLPRKVVQRVWVSVQFILCGASYYVLAPVEEITQKAPIISI